VVAPAPGQYLERAGVGLGDQVGFADAGQAFDGGAVEADALVKSAFEFGRGDGHRFEHAEHIGEPESDEAHVAFLDGPQHVFLLFVHSLLLVSSAVCSPGWCSPGWCSPGWCLPAWCSDRGPRAYDPIRAA